MNYGEILSKAWKIIWKHKVLWIFGLLASCMANQRPSGGGGGGSGYSFGGEDAINQGNMNGIFEGANGLFSQLQQFTETVPIWLIVMVFIAIMCGLAIVLFFISIVLGTFGKIGLVRGAWQADEGVERLQFSELWRESQPFFWRVILLYILRWLLGLVLTMLLILPFILVTILTLGCALCFLIPLSIAFSWLITILVEQSIIAIVSENLDIGSGINKAWQVITQNLLKFVLMALILMIGSGIVGLIIALPIFAIILPLIGGILIGENVVIGIGVVLSCLMLLVYIPVAIVLSSVLQAYLGTTWTLVYRRLTGREEILQEV